MPRSRTAGAGPRSRTATPSRLASRARTFPPPARFDALHAAGHRTIGLVWGAASPSAQVTRDAYERIVGDLVERLREAGPVDGVYLDLHGAMVTEHFDDGEGELLARVRKVVGPRRAGRRQPRPARQHDARDARRTPTGSMPTARIRTSTWRPPARARRGLLQRTINGGRADGQGDAAARFPDRACHRSARSSSLRRACTNCWPVSSANTTRACRSRPAFRWRIFPNAGWRCSATAPMPGACKRPSTRSRMPCTTPSPISRWSCSSRMPRSRARYSAASPDRRW